jgi:hypothetical protein
MRQRSATDIQTKSKRKRIMPDLFLSRGVLLLDRGDLRSAKNEFLAELMRYRSYHRLKHHKKR